MKVRFLVAEMVSGASLSTGDVIATPSYDGYRAVGCYIYVHTDTHGQLLDAHNDGRYPEIPYTITNIFDNPIDAYLTVINHFWEHGEYATYIQIKRTHPFMEELAPHLMNVECLDYITLPCRPAEKQALTSFDVNWDYVLIMLTTGVTYEEFDSIPTVEELNKPNPMNDYAEIHVTTTMPKGLITKDGFEQAN